MPGIPVSQRRCVDGSKRARITRFTQSESAAHARSATDEPPRTEGETPMSAVSSEPEPMDAETAADAQTGHPLFPRAEHETGPDKRRIELIHIERLKEDGTWEACPRVFKATEL